jgi:hypothetical protein
MVFLTLNLHTYNSEKDEEAEDGKTAHLTLVPTRISLLHLPAHAQQ